MFDPYLDSLGGGEQYILTIAECLLQDHQVTLFWDDPHILAKAETRFGLDLGGLTVKPSVFKKSSFVNKYIETKRYDVLFFVSDGSVPFLFSKKNILIFQFPINWVKGHNFRTQLKYKNISASICYSNFVKSFLDKTLPKKSIVIPPAVDSIAAKSHKENIILSVGRFTKAMNAKKQETMIDAFKKLTSSGLKNWRLVLAGSFLPDDEDFLDSLKKQAEGFPIEFQANISRSQLTLLYAKACIYWHAAGFGEDLVEHPERAEHFGITTVEAMSAGAVPIVINAGGQSEIVEEDKSGLLWITEEELQDKTMQVVNNKELQESLSKGARQRSKDFSKDQFYRNIKQLL